MTNDTPIPFWKFLLPFLFQTVLIITIPAQSLYTKLTGRTVILQTVTFDPYELLRGYSETMRYDISSQDSLRKLPGWDNLPKQQPDGNEVTFIKPGTRFYVILAAPTSPNKLGLPATWKPIAVSHKYPSKLPPDQVALKSLAQRGLIEYGLESYYIPDDERENLNTDLSLARQTNPIQPQQFPPIVTEVKVDRWGNALPISLWVKVGDDANQQIRHYRF